MLGINHHPRQCCPIPNYWLTPLVDNSKQERQCHSFLYILRGWCAHQRPVIVQPPLAVCYNTNIAQQHSMVHTLPWLTPLPFHPASTGEMNHFLPCGKSDAHERGMRLNRQRWDRSSNEGLISTGNTLKERRHHHHSSAGELGKMSRCHLTGGIHPPRMQCQSSRFRNSYPFHSRVCAFPSAPHCSPALGALLSSEAVHRAAQRLFAGIVSSENVWVSA